MEAVLYYRFDRTSSIYNTQVMLVILMKREFVLDPMLGPVALRRKRFRSFRG